MAITEEYQEKVLAEATGATPSYSVDLQDDRLVDINNQKDAAKAESSKLYDDVIGGADKYYDDLIQNSKDWEKQQTQIQKENTDFAIEKIEQQKEQANKDYIKEQSGAYADWQKQSNAYGVNAEKMASAGLTNTGYSESSQVSMYNAYQNRVAIARESLDKAILNYDNSIKDAMLQNNAVLAEIAYKALQEQSELALQKCLQNQQLTLEKANKQLEIEQMYHNYWQDMLQQINTENEMAWKTEQAELDRKFQEEQNRIQREFEEKQAALDRQHDLELENVRNENEKEQLKIKQEYELAQLKKEQEYALDQLDKKLANDKALLKYESELGGTVITGGGGSSSSSSSNSGYSSAQNEKFAIKGTAEYQSQVSTVSGNTVNTAYYSGALNSDAKKYGTFSNGYQPKGISGHGEVSKTGDTITFQTQTLYGQKQTVTQNIWKTPDGKKWYWDGRYNKYIQIK